MKSEQQKRAAKIAARIASNRQRIEAAGYSREEAASLASNRDFIEQHNAILRARRNAAIREALGAASPDLVTLVRKAIS